MMMMMMMMMMMAPTRLYVLNKSKRSFILLFIEVLVSQLPLTQKYRTVNLNNIINTCIILIPVM
jgi:hypothetical protein